MEKPNIADINLKVKARIALMCVLRIDILVIFWFIKIALCAKPRQNEVIKG